MDFLNLMYRRWIYFSTDPEVLATFFNNRFLLILLVIVLIRIKYTAVPSAMAPLLLLVIGFYLNRYYLPLMRPTMLNYVLYVLLQTIIIENAMPSGADFRVAGMYLKGILLYGFLLVALLVFM